MNCWQSRAPEGGPDNGHDDVRQSGLLQSWRRRRDNDGNSKIEHVALAMNALKSDSMTSLLRLGLGMLLVFFGLGSAKSAGRHSGSGDRSDWLFSRSMHLLFQVMPTSAVRMPSVLAALNHTEPARMR